VVSDPDGNDKSIHAIQSGGDGQDVCRARGLRVISVEKHENDR